MALGLVPCRFDELRRAFAFTLGEKAPENEIVGEISLASLIDGDFEMMRSALFELS